MSDWTQNPFAQADSDPFQDPSVTAAAGSGKAPEYNPFEGKAPAQAPVTATTRDVVSQGASSFSKPSKASVQPAPAEAPASESDAPSWAAKPVAKPAEQPQPKPAAPAAAPAAAKPVKKAEPARSVNSESADEAERKRQYEEREQKANPTEPKKDPNYRPANWPPFPQKCPSPLKPCFHQDFKGEIPKYGYNVSREAYYFWMFTSVGYFWNFVCCLAALDWGGSGVSSSAGVSCAFFVLGTPCAYCCWFHHLYTAFRLDSSVRYFWFFFVTCFQLIFAIFLAMGIPATGAAGFWVASTAVVSDKIIGIMLFSSAILWSLDACWCAWILKKVMFIYRTTGQSGNKAQRELTSAGHQAAYDTLTSDAGRGAAKAGLAAWASDDSNA